MYNYIIANEPENPGPKPGPPENIGIFSGYWIFD
jgi:hypothetical protein